jgi:hypothetical protein
MHSERYPPNAKLSSVVKSGIESAGGGAAIDQYVFNRGPICIIVLLTELVRVAETLPKEVLRLAKMHVPAKPSYPIITFLEQN